MSSIEDHLAAVRRLLPQLSEEELPVAEVVGRVLTREVVAGVDSPPFDNSQMDGYALSVDQVAAAPGEFRVGPTVAAGADPAGLYPEGLRGAIAPVMTGARLPRGTCAVVPVEKCTPPAFLEPGNFLRVPDAPEGQFVRAAGSDIARGQVLYAAGATVTPAMVAALVGQRIDTVAVQARASILIVTGGAEVGGEGAASIPDANAPLLAALAERHGIAVAGFVRTNDDPVALRGELERAVDKHRPTAVVTSGGISAGRFEVVRQLLEPTGRFGHVAQQPGGPQGLATFAGTPVLCLPGNPISTWVSFRMFVAPVLGHAPAPVTALLAETRRGLRDRTQLLRGTLTVDDTARLQATPMGGTSSHLLVQGSRADCLIRIPADTVVAAGQPVTVYPL